MNWKEFLKPSWIKIVLLLIFLVLSFFKTDYPFSSDSPSFSHGFPLYYLTEGYDWWSYPEWQTSPRKIRDILYFNLFIDLIFWYLLSCLIIWVYDKVKKKK
jgi:hypothetical protein